MQIILLGQGPHHDFAISGPVVTLGDVRIDCAAEQLAETATLSVFSTEQGMSLQGPGAFAATVAIPPRKYPQPEPTAEQLPESGEQHTAPEPLPLDPDTITLTLWPK